MKVPPKILMKKTYPLPVSYVASITQIRLLLAVDIIFVLLVPSKDTLRHRNVSHVVHQQVVFSIALTK